jgi:hypothetical protein
MQNPQTPNRDPHRDPTEVERAPGRNEDANDKGMPSPDRQRDPLQQPGDVPDVKPDVIAGKKDRKGAGQGQGTDQGAGSSEPRSPQRQKE